MDHFCRNLAKMDFPEKRPPSVLKYSDFLTIVQKIKEN